MGLVDAGRGRRPYGPVDHDPWGFWEGFRVTEYSGFWKGVLEGASSRNLEREFRRVSLRGTREGGLGMISCD